MSKNNRKTKERENNAIKLEQKKKTCEMDAMHVEKVLKLPPTIWSYDGGLA